MCRALSMNVRFPRGSEIFGNSIILHLLKTSYLINFENLNIEWRFSAKSEISVSIYEFSFAKTQAKIFPRLDDGRVRGLCLGKDML